MNKYQAIVILACNLGIVSLAEAQTLTLQASADTALWERNPSFNFGAQSELVAGSLASSQNVAQSRILYQFNIDSRLDESATIQSAQVKFTVVKTPPGAASSTFAVHRVLKSWNEGASSGGRPGGSEAAAGEATWITSGSVNWSTPGGAFGEDLDFASKVSGSVSVSDSRTYVINLNAVGLADLSSMRTNTADNHGWVLLSQSEGTPKTARRIASKENTSDRPTLDITYTLPAPFEVPLIDHRFDRDAEEVIMTISTEPGATYVLEQALGLVPPSWMPIGEATVALSGTLEMRGSSADLNAAFYRITRTALAP